MNSMLGDRTAVCVLAYNHEELIESALKPLLDQTLTGYEVIVSDDCSTDGTWERLRGIAAADCRIKLVQTPRNMGMPGNANFAVQQSTRPYVAILHHDDLCRRDLLEKWAGVLARQPRVGFVFNQYGVFGSPLVYSTDMPSEVVDGEWFLERHLFAKWGCAVRGTAMVRREAWDQVGGMREQFGLLADVDLWMRLSMRWPVGYVAEPLITVRQQRPDYYPDIYKSQQWSWTRQKYLYDIHAANRLAHWDPGTLAGRLRWWQFRWNVSRETAKWLVYSVVRKRRDMIASTRDSATRYDLWPLELLRRAVERVGPLALGACGRNPL